MWGWFLLEADRLGYIFPFHSLEVLQSVKKKEGGRELRGEGRKEKIIQLRERKEIHEFQAKRVLGDSKRN